jgi:hypothetical protein
MFDHSSSLMGFEHFGRRGKFLLLENEFSDVPLMVLGVMDCHFNLMAQFLALGERSFAWFLVEDKRSEVVPFCHFGGNALLLCLAQGKICVVPLVSQGCEVSLKAAEESV